MSGFVSPMRAKAPLAISSAVQLRAESASILERPRKQALNQIMQARGHIVVLLSAEQYRRNAETAYLTKFLRGKAI